MRQLEKKNIITDYQSKKYKWEDLGVPEELIHALEDLKMDKPSQIQAASIKEIVPNKSSNFMFQASNGSGKTLAFGIPAIMAVDSSIDAVQVIIIANTRELIRQVQAVLEVVGKNTKVTSCIGDTNTSEKMAHILVTVPGWLGNMIGGRKKFDLQHLRLICFDEADEIFI